MKAAAEAQENICTVDIEQLNWFTQSDWMNCAPRNVNSI
jgi:hypothetical protein